MSDAHHAAPAKTGGGDGGILEKVKQVFYIFVFLLVIVIFIYQILYNPANVDLFLSLLYGLEILLGSICAILIWRFWKFTKDFHHLCHEIDHIFQHKNHPHHKEHISYNSILKQKFDDISEIFKHHDSSLWPANFKSLNNILIEELKSKNISGETLEEMFRELLSKGFNKRKELDLLLRVKIKIQESFSKKEKLEISQLSKVAELYEFVVKEIANFGDSKEH